MKVDVALLIPIYPPHYHYMYDLINKLKNNNIQIDIYLVFSNNIDYDIFTMKSEIFPIIILEPLQRNSITTFKKFFGLKQLANSTYDYIICCDAEIDIICDNFTNENINDKIKHIFDTKCIYAGKHDNSVSKIIQHSADIFPGQYKNLGDITKNFTLYFWWSDLPVYRRKDITIFLNIIKWDNLVWEQFDYIIYQFYLILWHNFKIIDTTPITKINWSLELLFTNDSNILTELLRINYGFSWNNKKFYDLNESFIKSQKGFLIYHLDRV